MKSKDAEEILEDICEMFHQIINNIELQSDIDLVTGCYEYDPEVKAFYHLLECVHLTVDIDHKEAKKRIKFLNSEKGYQWLRKD